MFDHLAMWTWPTAVRSEDPRRMVDRLKAAHVDVIIPYVSSKQDAYAERLHRIIEEAHRQDIQVHGCFDEMNAHDSMPASVHALRQVFADGGRNGSLCPANPDAVQYIIGELRHVLADFDYDGINLEDSYIFNKNTIYDPAHQQGVDYKTIPVCYCGYCKQHAPIGKAGWEKWKQARLTDLIGEEAKLIRRMKPGMPFSVAARMPYARGFYEPFKNEIPYYGGWEFCQSRDAFAADWADWLKRGLIDFACPMSYFRSPRMVELQTQECRQLTPDAANRIWIGLTFGWTPEDPDHSVVNGAREIALLLERLEKLGQKNCVFFSYEAFRDEHIPVLAGRRRG